MENKLRQHGDYEVMFVYSIVFENGWKNNSEILRDRDFRLLYDLILTLLFLRRNKGLSHES